MILEHDTEPDVDVAIVNSYVTVAARNWCIVPIVVEATTTKDDPTLVLVYPNLIYKSKLFISFDFVFISLFFCFFHLYTLMCSMPDLQGSVPLLDVKHDTEPKADAVSACRIATCTARDWPVRPAVIEATTTTDGEFRCACSV